MKDKLKLAFIHPEIRDYRAPLLNKLASEYELTFIIIQRVSKIKSFPDRDKWNYQQFSRHVRIPGTNREFPPKIFTEILRGDYDVVVASDSTTVETMLAYIASKLSGKKFIVWNELWDYPKLPRFTLIKPLVKHITRGADALVAAGSKAKMLFRSFGAREENIFMSPNCALDYDGVPANDLSSELGLGDGKVILYLGRIVRYKGLDVLLRAFAKLCDFHGGMHLVVGGKGPFERECRSIVGELGLSNVHFVGHVSDVVSFYKMCDLFVLPARFVNDSCPSEAWGLVLNEVMSCGKPVVSTDAVAGAYDLIQDGVNGFKVFNNDVDELYGALEKILTDEELAASMGKNSRKLISEEFTYDKMYAGFKQAIDYACRSSIESH